MRGMFAESPFNGDVSTWSINPYARMGWMFKNAAFTGDISSWTNCGAYRLSMFSSFHDSPQGYFGVLINNYDFPQDHPQAATFHQLRALTESLCIHLSGDASTIVGARHTLIARSIITYAFQRHWVTAFAQSPNPRTNSHSWAHLWLESHRCKSSHQHEWTIWIY